MCGECTDGVGWSPSGDEGNDSDNGDRSCAQQGCSKGTKPPPRVVGNAQSSLCAAVWPKWCSCTQISFLIQKSSVFGVGAGTDWKHEVCGTGLLLSYFARGVLPLFFQTCSPFHAQPYSHARGLSAALSSSKPAPHPMHKPTAMALSTSMKQEEQCGFSLPFLCRVSLYIYSSSLLCMKVVWYQRCQFFLIGAYSAHRHCGECCIFTQ